MVAKGGRKKPVRVPDEDMTSHIREFGTVVQNKISMALSEQSWPEDQLKSAVDRLITQIGNGLGHNVVCVTESAGTAAKGRIDIAVQIDGFLIGHIELKKPGKGADTSKFKDHDKDQWERFKLLPNLLYTDGIEWQLYCDGEPVDKLVNLGNILEDGDDAVSGNSAEMLERLIEHFFNHEYIPPTTSKGIADMLAPLCRTLRNEVAAALSVEGSALAIFAHDWRQRLFPNADDDEVADAYAQTFTYALLIARFEGANLTQSDPNNKRVVITNISSAINCLNEEHSLLSEVLGLLTQPNAMDEVKTSADELIHRIGALNPAAITSRHSKENPWIYFYEEFLAAYDPELRIKAGAYYTPPEIVRAQVSLAHDLLVSRFGKPDAFASPDVRTLDPAVGTGTYLLGLLDNVVEHISNYAKGSVAETLRTVTKNIYGFEYMIAPYSVSHLRLSRYLSEYGIDKQPLNVFLADTLDSPEQLIQEPVVEFAYQAINKEREEARKVKADTHITVCLGNPPYRRAKKNDDENHPYGGWVTSRPNLLHPNEHNRAIFEDFLEPARKAGQGQHVKNLYNAYVYFWRWALWKVFDNTLDNDSSEASNVNPGIVSFITASSFLRGPGFIGMREYLRQVADEIWIIDLGGDNKGGRTTKNVFDIETPVCITMVARYPDTDHSQPAIVHYTDLTTPTVKDKLKILSEIQSISDFEWYECSEDLQAPFLPQSSSDYWELPLVTDIFPLQESGIQVKRKWPIGETQEVLQQRWRQLASPLTQDHNDDPRWEKENIQRRRVTDFKETRDRKIDKSYPSIIDPDNRDTPLSDLTMDDPVPQIVPYAYRSFDREYLIADSRVIDYPRPSLWRAHSDQQRYMVSFLTEVFGLGPAAVFNRYIPDLHNFRGSFGGKHVIPLWKNREATVPNLVPSLLETLSSILNETITAPDLFAYTYGLLGTPAYVDSYWEELRIPGPRLPITTDNKLFRKVATFGHKLAAINMFGTSIDGKHDCEIPQGQARYDTAISNTHYPETFSFDPAASTISIGDGRYTSVTKEVWEYSISEFKPIQSWLACRMLKRAGRSDGKSSLYKIRPKHWPDPTGMEFLHLLWVIEHSIAVEAEGRQLFDAVLASPVIKANQLPAPTENDRKPLTKENEQELFTL